MSSNVDVAKVDYAASVTNSNEENRILRQTVEDLHKELLKYRRLPLLVATVVQTLKPDKILIKLRNSNELCVSPSELLENKLKPGDKVLVEQKSLTIVERLGITKRFSVERFVIMAKPTTKWSEIGGLKKQINELKEVVELPLNKPELFRKVGIEPPKGVLLYGAPGTGKTLLAKAVAKSTDAAFIEIVGSELVQKFIGQGAKLVKSIFDLAREKAPAIIFIDELDAIAAKRLEIGTSGEREVQRTFMQLLAEIDGFKPLSGVKIIGATNRVDILDQAVIRPGRLDRLIEVGLPNKHGRLEIFKIHTKRMTLSRDINLRELVEKTKKSSGADIRSICMEAGYFAIREERIKVTMNDFLEAIKKVKKEEKEKDLRYIG